AIFVPILASVRHRVYGRPATAGLQAEISTQIDVTHLLVGENGVGVALGNDVAGADDVGGVADVQRLAYVVVGDQHADAALLEVADDVLDVVDGNRVDPCERFIKQDKGRVGGQSAGNFRAPALAAGQRHAETVADVGDVEFLQQLLQALLTFLARQVAARFEDCHDVVGDAQAPEDAGFLRQVANPGAGTTVHRQAGDVAIIDTDAAAVRRQQADNHVEAGGLAGAVRAEQADDFAGANLDRDILDYPAATIAFCKIGCRQR